MEFKAKLIKIGNSKGIIVPKKILNEIGKSDADEYLVNIECNNSIDNNKITIKDIDEMFKKQDIMNEFTKERKDTNE